MLRSNAKSSKKRQIVLLLKRQLQLPKQKLQLQPNQRRKSLRSLLSKI